MVVVVRNWSATLAVAAVLSAAATADGGSPTTNGIVDGGFSNATMTSTVPTSTSATSTTTFEASTATTTTAASKPKSVDVMLSKAENDPNLKYCTMDGLFCIPRNYSK